MGAKKPRVGLIGGTLATKSITLRGDNIDVEPTYFTWSRDIGDFGTVFYMDCPPDRVYADMEDIPPQKKVAILVEPRGLRPETYQYVEENYLLFDHVLTYDRKLLNAIPNSLFYPLGGSSIALEDWGVYKKTRKICMIVSEKKQTQGHQMRHQIVEMFDGEIDFYGAGVGKPFERKFDILKDYRYCVVVESDLSPDYFSEKLIDAVSVGCIPLHYCDRGNYCNVFFMKHHFTDIEGLGDLLIMIRNNMLYWDEQQLHYNLDAAKKFRIVEDFIFEVHKELFDDRHL